MVPAGYRKSGQLHFICYKLRAGAAFENLQGARCPVTPVLVDRVCKTFSQLLLRPKDEPFIIAHHQML